MRVKIILWCLISRMRILKGESRCRLPERNILCFLPVFYKINDSFYYSMVWEDHYLRASLLGIA